MLHWWACSHMPRIGNHCPSPGFLDPTALSISRQQHLHPCMAAGRFQGSEIMSVSLASGYRSFRNCNGEASRSKTASQSFRSGFQMALGLQIGGLQGPRSSGLLW